MQKIKNINGTTENHCCCGSWLKHWEKGNEKKASTCAALGCYKQATDGAHVQIDGSVDNSWYIVPLCHEHNMYKGSLIVFEPLISANKSLTCEK